MAELFFTGNAIWFSIPAFVGTAIFSLRLLLMLFGGHGMHAGDIDVGHTHTGTHHDDSGDSFRLLSLEALTGSMMGLGWGGLAALKGSDLSIPWVIAVGITCGIAAVWLQALLFRAVYQLQSSGNISIKDTLGTQGVVYVTVPAGNKGKGQVTLVINQRQRQFNAITPGDELPSKTRICVVSVNDDNTVTVQRAG